MKHFKILFALVITATMCMCAALSASAAEDTQTTRHYFTITHDTTKSVYFVEGEKVVAAITLLPPNGDYSKHWYELKGDYTNLVFYRLNSARTAAETVVYKLAKTYALQDGEWVVTYDGDVSGYISYSHNLRYKNEYLDFTDSGIDILEFNMTDRGTVFNKGTGTMDYKSVQHNVTTNIYSYLLNGTFTDFGKSYTFVLHSDLLNVVPDMHDWGSTSSVAITPEYDAESGVVSWSDFVVDEENTLKKGVIAAFHSQGTGGYSLDYYRVPLTGTSYKISLGGSDFNNDTFRYNTIIFVPYYISKNGNLYYGKAAYLNIDADSTAATRSADKLLTATAKASDKPSSIVPDKGDGESNLVDNIKDSVKLEDMTYRSGIKLTGFRADYEINASWREFTLDDKVTKMSNAESMIVLKKGVYVRLVYAYVNAPGQVAYTKYLRNIIDADDRSCYIPYSNYKSEDETVFLRDVEFIPVVAIKDSIEYKDNEWWFYGSCSYVRFNNDGSEDETGVNNGSVINNDSSSSSWVGSVSGNGVIDLGSVGDALQNIGWFGTVLTSLINGLGSVPSFFATIFGFLPAPVVALLGVFILACILLRFIGR